MNTEVHMGRFTVLSHRWASAVMAGCLVFLGVMSPAFVWAQDSDASPPAERVPQAPAAQATEQQDPVQYQVDEASARAALESELASAKRFEAEVAALLKPDGQLNTTLGDEAPIMLASLSTRCGILANSAMHDEVRFILLGYQARALSALASHEPANPQQQPSRLEQLKEVASQIQALALPGAQAAADYWVLLASLAEQSGGDASAAQVHALAERLLQAYLDKHADDAYAAEFLIDTRLSLARLLNQRGAQRQLADQLVKVGELPPDSPRRIEVKALRDSLARLDATIRFESITTQLEPWRSSNYLGKPLLIHIYADSVEPSVRMIDSINQRIVSGSVGGIAVVSIRVGDPVASTVSPPWPTLPVQLEPGGVLDQLGVVALPTLAWLDENGRLASIGTTVAVLDQLASVRPERPDASGVDAAQGTDSGDEQVQNNLETGPAEPESEPVILPKKN